MKPPYCFALIHSPLVGPFTWSLVAEQLAARHINVLLPTLTDDRETAWPYWQRHSQAGAEFFKANSPGQTIILTAHSGSGPLLPAIRLAMGVPVAAYLFVDAGIPRDGYSRLDLMAWEDP